MKYPSQAKWKERNGKAVWAQHALRSAIRRGLIEPKACEVCGSTPAEFHHPDYERPLYGSWLCRHHHKREHVRMRNAALGIQDMFAEEVTAHE